jgi:hypothetical protein
MKTGKIQPQMTQMNADSNASEKHLRQSAKSAVQQSLEGNSGRDRGMMDSNHIRFADGVDFPGKLITASLLNSV